MPSSPAVTIREATPADIPEIIRLRRGMYVAMDYKDDSTLDKMASLTGEYLAKAIVDGSFRAWLACDATQVVAGGAVIVSPWPAHPYDRECRRATILNVYTEPEYRRQGIARQLMRTMIDWSKQQGFARITLHASNEGKPLYESLGFEPSNEMHLNLR